jgi:hypothetical protein
MKSVNLRAFTLAFLAFSLLRAGTPQALHAWPASPLDAPYWTFSTGGGETRGPLLGDFNEDGVLDAASLNHQSDNLAVLFGDGAGSFSGLRKIAITLDGQDLAVADFNADGHLDLATVGFSTLAVEVYLGLGNGTFGPPVVTAIPYGAFSLAAGDFNGDGLADLMLAGYTTKRSVRLLGVGNGSFTSPQATLFASTVAFVTTGHLNADAHLDVVFSLYPDSIIALRGDGTGQFPLRQAVSVGTNSYPRRPTLADLDGDGDIDIVAGTQDLALVHNDGTGAFGSAITLPLADKPNSPQVADLNGDGHRDIAFAYTRVAADFLTNISWMGVLPGASGGGYGSVITSKMLTDGHPHSRVALTDLDADGLLDVVTAYGSGRLVIGEGHGNGRFANDNAFLSAPIGPSDIDLADLSGTGGPLDIALVTTSGCEFFHAGTVSTWTGAGDGTFVTGPSQSMGPSFCSPRMVLALFDADSKPDLAYFHEFDNTNLTIRHGNGDGTFQVGTTIPIASTIRAITSGDWNGDGRRDIALALVNQVATLVSRGDGTFDPAVYVNVGVDLSRIVVGRIDPNATDDLGLVDDSGPTFRVLFGNGSGTFTPGPTRALVPYTPRIALGDLNGDGLDELIATNDESRLEISIGNGTGNFGAGTIYDAGWFSHVPRVADVNGDGRNDVVVAGPSLSLFFGNGDGTLNPMIGLGVGNSPSDFAFGDLNADGALDIVVANVSDATLTVLVGDPSQSGLPDVTLPPTLRLAVGPNPSRGVFSISGALGGSGSGELDVFDVSGRKVRGLGTVAADPAGLFGGITWDGRDEAGELTGPGIYFVRLQSGGRSIVAKIVRVGG